jgi:hypothetical protein
MNPLSPFKICLAECVKELAAFDELLAKNQELKERECILPFFRSHKNLAAWIGSYLPSLNKFDRLNLEFTLFGDFRADLIVSDSASHAHCLVEFEDATRDSVFKSGVRSTSDWSTRFEHGFSQIVDWSWKIDDFRQTGQCRAIFGSDAFDFMGVLIVGRDEFIGVEEQIRLRWRTNKVTVNSQKILCITYDQLARDLRNGLALYQPLKPVS